ncbi:MAG: hypothetical protein CMO98_00990 [Woeseia sp.]|nr:hypothetical protein [Woeseia sp.]|tara:strand:- start:352 stop:801 length:450 start_codon:yes stop_codon:yes gene_type:complete
MTNWLILALLAALSYGFVGFLQKISVFRLSASALVVWVVVGLVLATPLFIPFWSQTQDGLIDIDMILIGIASGLFNGAGTWFLFRSLELGGKASITIPLTALYPLVTVALSIMLLGEQLVTHQWLGVALASLGAALLSYERIPESSHGI